MSLRASRVFRLSPASGIRRVLALFIVIVASGHVGNADAAVRCGSQTNPSLSEFFCPAGKVATQFIVPTPLLPFTSSPASIQQIVAACASKSDQYAAEFAGYRAEFRIFKSSDSSNLVCRYHRAPSSSEQCGINTGVDQLASVVCDDPPPPPSCDSDSGVSFQAVFPNDEYPPTLCNSPCSMAIEQRVSGFGTSVGGASTGFSIYQYRNNGSPCQDEPDLSTIDSADVNLPNAGDHSVITVPPGSGEAGDSQQCGLVNGERTCFVATSQATISV
jgi:hypothetical protein